MEEEVLLGISIYVGPDFNEYNFSFRFTGFGGVNDEGYREFFLIITHPDIEIIENHDAIFYWKPTLIEWF